MSGKSKMNLGVQTSNSMYFGFNKSLVFFFCHLGSWVRIVLTDDILLLVGRSVVLSKMLIISHKKKFLWNLNLICLLHSPIIIQPLFSHLYSTVIFLLFPIEMHYVQILSLLTIELLEKKSII